MEYNSIKNLPIVLFFEIIDTGNLMLLSETKSEQELISIWSKINEEYEKETNEQGLKRRLELNKKIERLDCKYKSIVLAIESLKVVEDLELITLLKKEGYNISDKNYLSDLEKAETEAGNILIKLEVLVNKLPKESENKTNIYDVLSSYCVVLGYDLDFEKVTVIKFLSLKKQVELKIKLWQEKGQ